MLLRPNCRNLLVTRLSNSEVITQLSLAPFVSCLLGRRDETEKIVFQSREREKIGPAAHLDNRGAADVDDDEDDDDDDDDDHPWRRVA